MSVAQPQKYHHTLVKQQTTLNMAAATTIQTPTTNIETGVTDITSHSTVTPDTFDRSTFWVNFAKYQSTTQPGAVDWDNPVFVDVVHEAMRCLQCRLYDRFAECAKIIAYKCHGASHPLNRPDDGRYFSRKAYDPVALQWFTAMLLGTQPFARQKLIDPKQLAWALTPTGHSLQTWCIRLDAVEYINLLKPTPSDEWKTHASTRMCVQLAKRRAATFLNAEDVLRRKSPALLTLWWNQQGIDQKTLEAWVDRDPQAPLDVLVELLGDDIVGAKRAWKWDMGGDHVNWWCEHMVANRKRTKGKMTKAWRRYRFQLEAERMYKDKYLAVQKESVGQARLDHGKHVQTALEASFERATVGKGDAVATADVVSGGGAGDEADVVSAGDACAAKATSKGSDTVLSRGDVMRETCDAIWNRDLDALKLGLERGAAAYIVYNAVIDQGFQEAAQWMRDNDVIRIDSDRNWGVLDAVKLDDAKLLDKRLKATMDCRVPDVHVNNNEAFKIVKSERVAVVLARHASKTCAGDAVKGDEGDSAVEVKGDDVTVAVEAVASAIEAVASVDVVSAGVAVSEFTRALMDGDDIDYSNLRMTVDHWKVLLRSNRADVLKVVMDEFPVPTDASRWDIRPDLEDRFKSAMFAHALKYIHENFEERLAAKGLLTDFIVQANTAGALRHSDYKHMLTNLYSVVMGEDFDDEW